MKFYNTYLVKDWDSDNEFYTIPLFEHGVDIVDIYYNNNGVIGWEASRDDITSYKEETKLPTELIYKLIEYIFDERFLRNMEYMKK